jgi:hypothetical protein
MLWKSSPNSDYTTKKSTSAEASASLTFLEKIGHPREADWLNLELSP